MTFSSTLQSQDTKSNISKLLLTETVKFTLKNSQLAPHGTINNRPAVHSLPPISKVKASTSSESTLGTSLVEVQHVSNWIAQDPLNLKDLASGEK